MLRSRIRLIVIV
ncbi:hypothetical protein LINGRAHAP2_LOCUS4120 [Linum grandiflorum]